MEEEHATCHTFGVAKSNRMSSGALLPQPQNVPVPARICINSSIQCQRCRIHDQSCVLNTKACLRLTQQNRFYRYGSGTVSRLLAIWRHTCRTILPVTLSKILVMRAAHKTSEPAHSHALNSTRIKVVVFPPPSPDNKVVPPADSSSTSLPTTNPWRQVRNHAARASNAARMITPKRLWETMRKTLGRQQQQAAWRQKFNRVCGGGGPVSCFLSSSNKNDFGGQRQGRGKRGREIPFIRGELGYTFYKCSKRGKAVGPKFNQLLLWFVSSR